MRYRVTISRTCGWPVIRSGVVEADTAEEAAEVAAVRHLRAYGPGFDATAMPLDDDENWRDALDATRRGK